MTNASLIVFVDDQPNPHESVSTDIFDTLSKIGGIYQNSSHIKIVHNGRRGNESWLSYNGYLLSQKRVYYVMLLTLKNLDSEHFNTFN